MIMIATRVLRPRDAYHSQPLTERAVEKTRREMVKLSTRSFQDREKPEQISGEKASKQDNVYMWLRRRRTESSQS